MIKKKDNPILGTVIHATLRNSDLLEAFKDALVDLNCHREDCPDKRAKNAVIQDAIDTLQQYSEDELNYPKDAELAEQISILINEDLMNALNDFAPPYCYFGAHPGDGSDFGFWRYEDVPYESDEDLVTVKDSLPEYILVINDHGNETLYSIDDNGQLWEEWICV